MKKSCLCCLLFTFVITVFFFTSGHTASIPAIQCPVGTLIEPYSGICALISDLKMVKSQNETDRNTQLPNLKKLRQQNVLKSELPYLENETQNVPPPGGIGAGTIFRQGALQTIEHGELHTKMFVHPYGVNPSSSGLSWLFTTATNRTEKGVEVVGIYYEDNPNGDIGVFDWSCSPEYPCVGGETGASWIWTSSFTNFPCNMKQVVDMGEHLQTIMQYANQTIKLDNGTPPLWRNAVYLWNFCDGMWDLIYEHEYRMNQVDCSISSECGWWGPILETFSDLLPEIDEIGFEDSLLLHDGVWSELRPDETDFIDPAFPWFLYHLDPNRGFGVGNRFFAAIDIIIDIKPGSYPNSINLKSKGKVPVAILSTDDFAAYDVDPETCDFAGATPIFWHMIDLGRDGDVDMILHFKTQELTLDQNSTEASLECETYGGENIIGTDTVNIVPKDKGDYKRDKKYAKKVKKVKIKQKKIK